jgi:hypothetical protein
MKKGIYLQATVGTGGQSLDAVREAVRQKLAGAHEGLNVQVKRITPAGDERAQVIVYIEGDQPPPEDFEALTTGVVRQLWDSSTSQRALGPALSLQHLVEKDDYEDEEDDSTDLVLPPQPAASEGAGAVAKEPDPPPAASEGAGAVAKEPAAPIGQAPPATSAAAAPAPEEPTEPPPSAESDADTPAAPVRGEQVIPTLPPPSPHVSTGPGVVAGSATPDEPQATAPPPAPQAEAPVETAEQDQAPAQPPKPAALPVEPQQQLEAATTDAPVEAPAAAREPAPIPAAGRAESAPEPATPPPAPKPRASGRPPRSSKRRNKSKGRRGH